jgi:hypothetical protein
MDNLVTYRVKVFTRNAILIFRGKKIRTPVECHNVHERELPVLKTQMLQNSLKFEVTPENEINEVRAEPLVVEKREEEVKVEELYIPEVEELYIPEEEPNNLMDQLIAEEKRASE